MPTTPRKATPTKNKYPAESEYMMDADGKKGTPLKATSKRSRLIGSKSQEVKSKPAIPLPSKRGKNENFRLPKNPDLRVPKRDPKYKTLADLSSDETFDAAMHKDAPTARPPTLEEQGSEPKKWDDWLCCCCKPDGDYY